MAQTMSGEYRLAREALKLGLYALPVASLIAFFVRGAHGAASVALGFALVLGNIALSAWVVTWAGRKDHRLAAEVAVPSYVTRMALMTLGMWLLLKIPFIDKASFLASICVVVAGTIVIEARTYKSTPWAALTFMGDKQ